MKHTFLSLLAICGLTFLSSNAMAADAAKNPTKPISKISDVKAMPDDTEVVIQGVIVQNLGDEDYLVKDDSGTVTIEIDEDLVHGNTITPEAEVLITATVDQDDNVTSLEAEEVQFMPANAPMAAAPANSNAK